MQFFCQRCPRIPRRNALSCLHIASLRFRQIQPTNTTYMPRTPLSLLWLAAVCLGSCSVIQKSSYWKAAEPMGSWQFIEGKTWAPYYTGGQASATTPPYYLFCSSEATLTLSFRPTDKCVFWGPPLVPFIPGKNVIFPNDNRNLQVEITIQSKTSIDAIALSRNVHLFLNDSSVECPLIPDTAQMTQGSPSHANIARLVASTNTKATAVNTIRVEFGNTLTHPSKVNLQPLYLKRKNRLHYFALQVPVH